MDIIAQLLVLLEPWWGYLSALVIIMATLIAVKIVSRIFHVVRNRVSTKTDSSLDDVVLDAAKGPVKLGVLLLGVFFAIGSLDVLTAYSAEISTLFTVVFSLYAAYILSKIVGTAIEFYTAEIAVKTRTKADDQFLPIIKRAAYGIIFGIVFLIMLNQLGVRVETAIAAMGIGGLAFALALQPTLSNFFSGVYMIIDRPIKIGDYIELDGGDKGTVVDIGWRTTRIRTFTNNIVVIPNNKMADSKIINYNVPNTTLGFVVTGGVAYGSDLDKVEKVALETARNVMKRCNGPGDFKPLFRFNEFGDSSINFKVVMRTKTLPDRYLATHEFIKNLKKRFDEEGIEIPFPQVDVHTDKAKKRRHKR